MITKELFRQSRRARFLLLACVVLSLLWTLLVIAQMSLLATVISDVFFFHRGVAQVSGLLLLLLGTILGRAILTWCKELCAQECAIHAKTQIRERLFRHLLALGPSFTQRERTGELVALLNEGVERLDPYVSRYLPQIYLSATIPALVLLYLFHIDWISASLLLLTAPIIPLFMVMIGKLAEASMQRQWSTLARMSAHFLDAIQGLPTLKLFGRSRDECIHIQEISEEYRQTTMGVLKLAFLSGMVLEFMTAMAIALVAVMLGIRLLNHDVVFRSALLVLLLAPEFYRPLRDLGTQRHAGMEGKEAALRIQEILHVPVQQVESVRQVESVPQVELRKQRENYLAAPLTIEFVNVGYSYPGRTMPALSQINLTLPPASCTALVGRSGAGKSTLVQLLLRFMDCEQGEIRVNGLPLSALTPEAWRAYVALVPQQPYLFYGSVEENIRLARPLASQQEIESAAHLAGADDFIRALPQGYATPLGERGARLSMGQAQRIAIARAFLKDAPLLILDEPTSGLDPSSESLIQQSLARLMQDRTVLVIAHRYNTIRQASQVALLEQGRLIEPDYLRLLLAGEQQEVGR